MPNPSVKLLLSCVSGEFGEHRDALRRALTRPNVEVKIQEDFKALGGDTLNMLEEYVEQCEAVVHFVGDMAGSTPAASSVDDLLRLTNLEHAPLCESMGRSHLAAERGRPRRSVAGWYYLATLTLSQARRDNGVERRKRGRRPLAIVLSPSSPRHAWRTRSAPPDGVPSMPRRTCKCSSTTSNM